MQTNCWNYDGVIGSHGYGQIWFKSTKKHMLAHHHFYSVLNGEIPKGMYVLHRCDNKRCVRPDHLFLGTQQDNLNDMKAKDRQGTGPHLPSEDHGMAKLTWKDVREIRKQWNIGLSDRGLGRIYKVAYSTIGWIVRNKTWIETKRG